MASPATDVGYSLYGVCCHIWLILVVWTEVLLLGCFSLFKS